MPHWPIFEYTITVNENTCSNAGLNKHTEYWQRHVSTKKTFPTRTYRFFPNVCQWRSVDAHTNGVMPMGCNTYNILIIHHMHDAYMLACFSTSADCATYSRSVFFYPSACLGLSACVRSYIWPEQTLRNGYNCTCCVCSNSKRPLSNSE